MSEGQMLLSPLTYINAKAETQEKLLENKTCCVFGLNTNKHQTVLYGNNAHKGQ